MVKVDIVSIGNVLNKNGVNTFMINLLKSKEKFYSNNIEIEKLVINGCDININIPISQSNISKRKNRRIIDILKNIKNVTFIGNLLSFINRYIFGAIKNRYRLKKDKTQKTFFVQDIITCYFLKKENSKIIMTIHSSENPLIQFYYNYPKFKNTFMEKIMDHILEKAILKSDAIVVLSNNFKNKLLSQGYKNIYSIYNGIPKATLSGQKLLNTKEEINIITVASINYRKGIDILINSFLKLSESERKKIKITIVGIGSESNLFKRLVSTNNLTNNIVFLGLRYDIEELLVQNDLFLLPSRDEGLPIAMLEAMSLSLPLALTNVGSIPEAMKQGTYYPLEPNIESLERFYKKLINKEIDLNELSRNSTTFFNETFSIDSMINQYSEVIKKINE